MSHLSRLEGITIGLLFFVGVCIVIMVFDLVVDRPRRGKRAK